MSQLEIYEYSQANKFIAVFVPGLIIGLYFFFFLFPFWSQNNPASVPRFIIIMTAAGPLTLAFAVGVHLMYPAVHVSGNQLKIKTSFYESGWFSFDKVDRINLPESKLTTQVVSVTVPLIHPLYAVVGLSQGILGRTFLIHPRMRNGQRLVRKLYNKRRDLFEEIAAPDQRS